MAKYDQYIKYLDLLSLLLVIIITIMLIWGCNKSNVRKVERFENKLTDFQSQIVDDIKKGNINNDTIKKYLSENKLKKEDIDAIIKFLSS